MFHSAVLATYSEHGRKSPEIPMGKCRREGALQGHHDGQYHTLWIDGHSRDHRLEAAASRFERDRFDSRKQDMVLRRGLGFIRGFDLWLQKN
jgi:hypothetical protein